MKVILESTDHIVELQTPNGVVPARLWEGATETGIRCHAFITRIAVHKDADSSQFDRELQEHHAELSPLLQGVYTDRRLIL